MILVSACLAGKKCRFDGGSRPDPEIMKMVSENQAIAACPECAGGLKIPREPSELTGTGEEVLSGKAKAMSLSGEDRTEEFLAGARAILELCAKYGIKKAILKAKSPSCGVGEIYDGTFCGKLRSGDGVAAALLRKNGIELEAR